MRKDRHVLTKEIALYHSNTLKYPEPNEVYIKYYLDEKLLCTFGAHMYLANSPCEVARYLKKVRATEQEKRDLTLWYLLGNDYRCNPESAADDDGNVLDYITYLRQSDRRAENSPAT